MRLIKYWIAAMAVGMALAACGDGSVRSPGLIGSGPVTELRLECRTPAGAQCSEPNRVIVGEFVNYRIIATFQDGTQADVTNISRFGLTATAQANRVDVTGSGENKGRTRGVSPTPDGSPAVITATDTQSSLTASKELIVLDSTPSQVQVFRDSNCTQPADGLTVASGAPTQLYARVSFLEPALAPICRTQDTRLTWSADPATNPDGSQVINNSGRFIGKNDDPDEEAEFSVTATFEGVSGNATLLVEPAEIVPDSLRLQPAARNIAVGGEVTYRAFISFDLGDGEIFESEITQSLDSLVSDRPNVANFVADEDKDVNNVLRGLAPSEDTPVVITATFVQDDGTQQQATATVNVLAADFEEIVLVPVGVDAFEAAGFFNINGNGNDEELEEELAELRQMIAQDALTLGHDIQGRLPCAGELCPEEGHLAQHQTLVAAPPLAYAVFAFNKGEPGFGQEGARGILLDRLEQTCFAPDEENGDNGDSLSLPLFFEAEDDEIIALLREVPIPGSAVENDNGDNGEENGDPPPPQMQAAQTRSGIRIVLAEGVTDGDTVIRARLGRDFDEGDSGVNCRNFFASEGDVEDGLNVEVEDAEQEVEVGLRDGNGDPIEVTSAFFNINTNYACVGFVNATDLVTNSDFRGREKLLSSLTYVVGQGEDAQRLVVNMNQSSRVNFSVNGGPANPEHQSCRFEGDDFESPRVVITNDLLMERGVMGAPGALALGNDCAKASFTPPPTLVGFADEDAVRNRTATVVALPVDDDIVRGSSAFGEPGEAAQLCDSLAPLLTLPFGQFAGEQGAGLLTELIGLLGAILGPVLNNEVISGPLAEGLSLVLEGLQEVLGVVFSIPGLGDLLELLVCFIGLPACPEAPEPIDGISLLPTILDGLNQGLQMFRDQWDAATGVIPPPETTNPGDPFRAPPPDENGNGNG